MVNQRTPEKKTLFDFVDYTKVSPLTFYKIQFSSNVPVCFPQRLGAGTYAPETFDSDTESDIANGRLDQSL